MAGWPIEGTRLFVITLEGLEKSVYWPVDEKRKVKTQHFYFTNSVKSTMKFKKMKMEKFTSYISLGLNFTQ